MRKHSSSLVAAALGVAALALVAVFGIFLPKAESGSESGSTTAPALPEKVGDFVALDSGRLPAALQQQVGSGSRVRQAQDAARAGLKKVDGVTASYRYYASTDAQSLAAVTVVPGDPGLFSPDGPPVAASQQSTYQLRRVGGAVCAEYYSQQQSTTGQTGGPLQQARAHCQLGAHGDTYDIDAQGLSTVKTVALVKRLADA